MLVVWSASGSWASRFSCSCWAFFFWGCLHLVLVVLRYRYLSVDSNKKKTTLFIPIHCKWFTVSNLQHIYIVLMFPFLCVTCTRPSATTATGNANALKTMECFHMCMTWSRPPCWCPKQFCDESWTFLSCKTFLLWQNNDNSAPASEKVLHNYEEQ